MTDNTPTREQYEAAARFAGVEIFGWFDGGPLQNFKPEWGMKYAQQWKPHLPSEDAFRLLCAVDAYRDDSMNSPERVAYRRARKSGNPEAVAQAAFNLAAAIGQTMKGEKE